MLATTYYGVIRRCELDDAINVSRMSVYADVAQAHAVASYNSFEYPSLGEWVVVPMNVDGANLP